MGTAPATSQLINYHSLFEEQRSEELRDFPLVIDCKAHEGGQGYPWPIRGRVIWVLNRFIEEPAK